VLGPGDLWYKDALIYSLDVETFQDSDGDGIGDFAGLTARVDYLRSLGVTCVWLQPFFPSPNRDNGYDVADYYGVDPRLGTLGDLVDFLRLARERGIRVMIDLVVNHTSDQHPWFQAARADRTSRYRDFYVWADERPADADEGMVFPGVESATWTYDDVAGAWYFHRFYHFQPDLNLANPAVREEIRKVMGFWLELGVSGFRVDAAPFLVDLKGVDPSRVERKRPHTFFRHMRNFLSWRLGDAALLAEANVLADDVADYVGTGDKLHMLFNFWVNQHLFLALAQGTAAPLAGALRDTAILPPTAQWAFFLRNHDECDLGRLAEAERAACYAAFGPDAAMQLYDRGVRRRLTPMLGNDRARLELAWSLLLAMPGTPVLYYGDEIGMGDLLALPERDAVRTPMQWTSTRNAGFSDAPAERLVRPLPAGEYGPARVNVTDQQHDPGSLLNWVQRALRVRKTCPEIARGTATVLDTGDPRVLALRYAHAGDVVVTLHNLSDADRSLSLGAIGVDSPESVTELLSDQRYRRRASDGGPAPRAEHGRLTVGPFGYRWLRLAASA
jgi:maltose alpha-D-glucosyltransferase / alpha-amylase